MSASCIHHLGIGVRDEKPMLNLFQQQLGFHNICKRVTELDMKWVLQKDRIVFVITKLNLCGSCHIAKNKTTQNSSSAATDGAINKLLTCDDTVTIATEQYDCPQPSLDVQEVQWNSLECTQNPCKLSDGYINSHYYDIGKDDAISTCETHRDRHEMGPKIPNYSTIWSNLQDVTCATINNSVYEVCLQVNDVAKSLARAVSCGASLIRPLTVVKDDDGYVEYATVRSCVGNVQHTLLNTTNYNGCFLPEFESCHVTAENLASNSNIGTLSFDHITLCVEPGRTLETISWYEKCFFMHRLIVNK